MALNLKPLTALRRRLPERAYIRNLWSLGSPHGTPPVLGIRFGQPHYFPVFTGRTADELNAEGGVTKQQLSAMVAGITHGWSHPAADPDHHKEPESEPKPA